MGMPTVSATKLVRIDYSQPLFLRVEVGDGMPGGTDLRGPTGSGRITVEEVQIPGGEAELRFSTLHVATTVDDNSVSTNHTSVTYLLRNGDTVIPFPFELILPENERFALYLIDFTFI